MGSRDSAGSPLHVHMSFWRLRKFSAVVIALACLLATVSECGAGHVWFTSVGMVSSLLLRMKSGIP